MKHRDMVQLFIAGCLCFTSFTGLNASPNINTSAAISTPLTTDALAKQLSSARAPFIQNDGQIAHDAVQYYSRMFAGTLFVTGQNDLVYALPQRTQASNDQTIAPKVWAFSESFSGARPSKPQGEKPSPIRVSHYKGNNKTDWKQQLNTWDSLSLGELYAGIRVSLKATGNNVEKLFYIAPGANTSDIDIVIDGINAMLVDQREQLVLKTSLGDIVFTAPVAYQWIDGKRREVEVSYVLADNNHYGFSLGDYDRNHELVIDPLLASTYIGGQNPNPPGNYDDDIIHGMVVSGGDIYVGGATQSPDFPVNLGYDETLDSSYPDGFITRISGDLSTIIASTYIGTETFDRVTDIAADTDGSIIVTGQAGGGFPLTDGAYSWSDVTPTGGGFVARFSADLSTLLASSIPTPGDYPARVALGNNGVYFGGSTNNRDFPITPGAYMDTCCPSTGGFGIRDYDGFAGKLSSDLGTLEAMTYLGGDFVAGITVAPDGNVYIADGADNEITGYLARMDAGLTTRSAYLTYYPGSTSGSSRTYFKDVVAADGFVVAAGQTYMSDLPATSGAFDTTCGTDAVCNGIGPFLYPIADGFVAVYSDDLQQTLALTYLGGSDMESIRSVELGSNGDIFVTGETSSVDFPTTGNAADTSCGSDGQCNPTGSFPTPTADGFVARLSADLSTLQYGSYLGASGEDRPSSIALDQNGLVYVAGSTDSVDFPTTAGAFDNSYNGGTSDAIISLFDTEAGGGINLPPVADAGTDQNVGPRIIVNLDGNGSTDPDGQIVSYHWTQVYGVQVSLINEGTAAASFRSPFVRPGVTRVLVFQLEVTDNQGATATDWVRIDVSR